MKKIFKYAFAVMAGVASIYSCTDEMSHPDGDHGLSLRIGLSSEGVNIVTYATDEENAIAALADIDNFRVTLTDNATGAALYAWERYADMPPVVEVVKGSYTITAESGNVKLAGFDSPHFKGEERIGVYEGQLNEVNLLCKLHNVAVHVDFDESFASQLDGGTLTIAKANAGAEKSELVFTPEGSERYGFFSVGPLRVTAKGFSKKTGSLLTYTIMIDETEANQLHRFHVSAMGVGEAELGITIDGSMTDKDHIVSVPEEGGDYGDGSDFGDGDNPWDDEEQGGEAGDPSINGKNFDISKPLTFTAEQAAGASVVVNFSASEGIANLFVEIDSPFLTEDVLGNLNIPKKFDIAHLADNLKEGFVDLGLIGEEPIADAKSTSFSVGAFMGLLDVNTHKFHLRLVDNKGAEVAATLTVIRK
ncbi:MAG: DUF4493 domain-containing protein [Rikenellaceae bacterium]|nr:DUF4493 domain-containing protein [Rikenellaceae bacterium]